MSLRHPCRKDKKQVSLMNSKLLHYLNMNIAYSMLSIITHSNLNPSIFKFLKAYKNMAPTALGRHMALYLILQKHHFPLSELYGKLQIKFILYSLFYSLLLIIVNWICPFPLIFPQSNQLASIFNLQKHIMYAYECVLSVFSF